MVKGAAVRDGRVAGQGRKGLGAVMAPVTRVCLSCPLPSLEPHPPSAEPVFLAYETLHADFETTPEIQTL